MNHHYLDITSRIEGAPLWWDEHAVPRYCEFAPDKTANIYASEAVLLLIACQGCGTEFKVAFSQTPMGAYNDALPSLYFKGVHKDDHAAMQERMKEFTLEAEVSTGRIHYGDPPNTGCCAAGPTMNSIPVRVLEFWERHKGETEVRGGVKVVVAPIDYMAWKRRADLEVEIDVEWARGGAP